MPRFSDHSGSDYMTAAELTPAGKRHPVVISHVAEEEVGRDRERKLVVHLINWPCGLILNKTNRDRARGARDFPRPGAWPGRWLAGQTRMMTSFA